MSGCMATDRPFQDWSSDIMKMIFGRSGVCALQLSGIESRVPVSQTAGKIKYSQGRFIKKCSFAPLLVIRNNLSIAAVMVAVVKKIGGKFLFRN